MTLSELYKEYEVKIRRDHSFVRGLNFVPGVGECGGFIFLAQNPGAEENVAREPLVGQSGQLLRKTLDKLGFGDNIFYTNVWKWMTPSNRTPYYKEIKLGKECLYPEIEIVNPHTIVMLGTIARDAVDPKLQRGKLYKSKLTGISYMYTYHPGYLLPYRSPEMIPTWEEHLAIARDS